MSRMFTRFLAGGAALALVLLAGGPALGQTDVLLRMDTDGDVEGALGFESNKLADSAHKFDNMGFPGGGAPPAGFGNFPDFGGRVQKFYFELPPGVTSISALTIFDDHSLGTCITGQASFDAFTGPEIYAIEGYDGAIAIHADSVARYTPGIREFSANPVIIELSDNQYGDDIADPAMLPCPVYNHLRGTNAGILPNLTAGLAGIPNMLLGPPDPTGHDVYGTFQITLVHDGMGNATGILDCDSDTVADLAVGPIYGDPAPPGKRPWPGYVTIGCGGTITLNFAVPAVPKPNLTGTTADADIVIYEVGFSEEPLTAVGSSTQLGQVNTDTLGGPVLDCIGVPGVDPNTTGTANIIIVNESEATYTSGGFPPFGFEIEKYVVRVVDGSGFFPVQEREYLASPISPEFGINMKTLQAVGDIPFDVTCQSVFYFYAFGDDDAFGNPDDDDGDGLFGSIDGDLDDHPEQIFASDADISGVSFLGFTGIAAEPICYKGPTPDGCAGPALTTVGKAVPVLNGGGAGSWQLYSFGNATPIGSATVVTATPVEVHPRSLNLNSPGRWVTIYVEPEGIDPTDLDPTTVRVEGRDREIFVPAVRWRVGDGNNNGIADLMLKVSRDEFAGLFPLEPGILQQEALVTVRGLTFGGREWSAQDTILVKNRGQSRSLRARGR